jgi:hypothetical protein
MFTWLQSLGSSPDLTIGSAAFHATRVAILVIYSLFSVLHERRTHPVKRDGHWLLYKEQMTEMKEVGMVLVM